MAPGVRVRAGVVEGVPRLGAFKYGGDAGWIAGTTTSIAFSEWTVADGERFGLSALLTRRSRRDLLGPCEPLQCLARFPTFASPRNNKPIAGLDSRRSATASPSPHGGWDSSLRAHSWMRALQVPWVLKIGPSFSTQLQHFREVMFCWSRSEIAWDGTLSQWR